MQDLSLEIAENLLKIEALKINTLQPYTWASGWKSPIYCDNRIILSFPEIRNRIRNGFITKIKEHFADVELIAGVATGAIAHAMLVADSLNLPFIYVRPAAKSHGLGNAIEGKIHPGKKVVVIEDLISTGTSSLKAVNALREAEMNVLGLLAIFSYNFNIAKTSFEEAECEFFTLSNYIVLLKKALEVNYIKDSELDILNKWRNNPENWLT